MNNKIDNRITETYLVILITFFRQLFVYFFHSRPAASTCAVSLLKKLKMPKLQQKCIKYIKIKHIIRCRWS